MVLSHDFYAQASQIIPVLLLTGLIEMAATSRRWEKRDLPPRAVLCFLAGLVLIALGEVSALWAVSEDAETWVVRTSVIYGMGTAGVFTMLPLVDSVCSFAGDPGERPKWLDAIGGATIMLPFFIAVMVSAFATS